MQLSRNLFFLMLATALLAVPVVSSAGGGGGGSCFPAGTQISLPNGDSVNIEDVKVGDVVASYDVKTSSFVEATVLELESPVREGYYEINDDLLRVTNEHPLYAKKGWASIVPEVTYEDTKLRPIAQLEVGSEVFTEGGWVEVTSIEYVEGAIRTYNLKSVDKYNTFFADGVLAHNKDHGGFCCGATSAVGSAVGAIGAAVGALGDAIGAVADAVGEAVQDVSDFLGDVIGAVFGDTEDDSTGTTSQGWVGFISSSQTTEVQNPQGEVVGYTEDGRNVHDNDGSYEVGPQGEGGGGGGDEEVGGGACTVQACIKLNACNQTQGFECVGGTGSYSCNAPAPTALPDNYLGSCNSTATNSCTDTGTGIVQCGGCDAVAPAERTFSNPDRTWGEACFPANSCGSNNPGTYTCDGTCSTTAPANPAGYGSACMESNRCGDGAPGTQTCSGTCSQLGPICADASGSISTQPLLVLSGGTTSVTWSTQLALDCSVTGTNGDSWDGVSGSETTGAITEETIYTLYCVDGDFTDETTVQVAPAWQEF
ncbi:hypothetical protein COB52_04565 [Candidatus Kaiserbacteria bacterium]|nr:MAG: hypothetical protein COB52_04565 [Candidatus Kaiserbacteria bacterium]